MRSVALFALVVCIANAMTIIYDRMIVNPLESQYKIRDEIYFTYLTNQNVFQQAELMNELTVTGSFQTDLVKKMTSFLTNMNGRQQTEFGEFAAVLALDRGRRITVAKLYAQVAYRKDESSYNDFEERIDRFLMDGSLLTVTGLIKDDSGPKVASVVSQMKAAAIHELEAQRIELQNIDSSIGNISLFADILKYGVVFLGIIGSLCAFFMTVKKTEDN